LTDLVKGKAASSDALLKKGDFDLPGFVEKIIRYQPGMVAFNGREAAKKVVSYLVRQDSGALGPIDLRIEKTSLYVLPSSSSSAADPKSFLPKHSKVDWWRALGSHVRKMQLPA